MRSLTGYRSLIGYQTKEKGTCVQIRGEKLIRLVFWDRIQNSIRPVFWDGGSILVILHLILICVLGPKIAFILGRRE